MPPGFKHADFQPSRRPQLNETCFNGARKSEFELTRRKSGGHHEVFTRC